MTDRWGRAVHRDSPTGARIGVGAFGRFGARGLRCLWVFRSAGRTTVGRHAAGVHANGREALEPRVASASLGALTALGSGLCGQARFLANAVVLLAGESRIARSALRAHTSRRADRAARRQHTRIDAVDTRQGLVTGAGLSAGTSRCSDSARGADRSDAPEVGIVAGEVRPFVIVVVPPPLDDAAAGHGKGNQEGQQSASCKTARVRSRHTDFNTALARKCHPSKTITALRPPALPPAAGAPPPCGP